MENNQNDIYKRYVKTAWLIYGLLTALVVVVLVIFVARDNEERFFYTLMPIAAAWVFRPMNKPFSKLIYKFTGMSYPDEKK